MLRPLVLAVALLAGSPSAHAAPAAPADFVFHSGKVYTVNTKKPWADTVVVRDGRIVHVGKNDPAAKAMVGKTTRVVDLKGRMLLPGFIDGHIHPIASSFVTAGVDLQRETYDDMVAAIRTYARENPTGPVWGFGWRPDMFPAAGPDKRILDEIFPDRPVFMLNVDFHSVWVNSKALKAAGIDRHTPDPMPGFSYYQRDAKGDITGFVLEPPAVMPIMAAVVPMSVQSLEGYVAKWMPKASAAGLTALMDAGVPPMGDQGEVISLYTNLEKAGKLPVRVVASYITRSPDEPPAVPAAKALQQQFQTPLVKVQRLKILADGTEGGHTAVLLEPYADKPDTRGVPPFSQEQLNQLLRDADKAGLDPLIHCDGDGCTRMALDAVEATIKSNPKRDRRPAISHLVTIGQSDIARFAKLGVIAQMGINWATADADTLGTLRDRLGKERFERDLYRGRSLVDAGARLAAGTDWAAAGYYSTYKPLDVIEIAMTRRLIGKPDAPMLPPASERMTLAQMIRAYTIDPAYQLRLEQQIGSIEVGKQADLVVLDKNLFDVEPHRIHDVKVTATMMNGRLTHEAGL